MIRDVDIAGIVGKRRAWSLGTALAVSLIWSGVAFAGGTANPKTSVTSPTVAAADLAAARARARTAFDAKNYDEALRLYGPLAENGDPESQYYMARAYQKIGDKKNQDELVKWYMKSAEGGYPDAQYQVAVGYAYGLAGLKRNDVEAGKWLRRAAEGGHRKAQKYLGQAYAEGRYGFPVDQEQAEYWTKKSESHS
jgi:TPR repeat protein